MLLIRIFTFAIVTITLLYNIQCYSQEAATAQYDDYYSYTDTTSKILSANTDDYKVKLRILLC